MKTAGAKDVAPRIRGAFLAAISGDNPRVNIHDKMVESLNEDFRATLAVLSKYIPKEMLLGGDPENPLHSGEFNVTIEFKKAEEST